MFPSTPRQFVAPALVALVAHAAAAGTARSVDPASGLETWETQGKGLAVRLTQISPEQAQAFFEARGFPTERARHYARDCVFMTVVRNTGTTPVELDLRRWRYQPRGGEPRPLKVKEEWLSEWDARGIDPAARIGFEWSQFPTTQTFAPADWNQGMTTYALPRGARFDLIYEWQSGDKTHAGRLAGARCARSEEAK